MRRSRALAKLAGRSYWREDDARHIVDAWRQSGEPIGLFAERLGIDRRRVSRWAARLERATSAAFRFVPVRVADGHEAGHGASIDIELARGACVRVPPGFAAEHLRRILAILDERRPC